MAGAAVLAAPAPAHTDQIKATVALSYQACGAVTMDPPCNEGSYLYGSVKSKKTACYAEREVTLRAVGGNAFGTAITDSEGAYKSSAYPGFADGQVEAVIHKLRFGAHMACTADVSPPVHYFLPP
jgi:hypothetical protein